MFNNLIAEIARNKLTQNDLAKVLGVTPKTISNKINGKSDFTLTEINAIKNLLPSGLTLEYLFATGDEHKAG